MKVRIVELSEPLRGNDRFVIETQTKERKVSYFWGLYSKTVYDWEVAAGTHLQATFTNIEDAEVAAKRWHAIINPTYHYL